MVSLSVGHYGALRHKYNDVKTWIGAEATFASENDYEIHTPWVVTHSAGGDPRNLTASQRIQNQFALPILRKDINKQ